MNQPDMDDLRMIEESHARLTDRRARTVHRQALSEIISLRATSALRAACGLEDVEVEHGDRGRDSASGRADHRLRASDGVTEMDTARLTAGGAGRCISELAATILQRRALMTYVAARRRGGAAADGTGWRGGQMLHPAAFLMEKATGTTMQAGRVSASTSRILPAVSGPGGIVPRRIFLEEGSPDVPWSQRRPTRLGIEMQMPDVMAAALAGRRLRDVISPDLEGHQDEAFTRLVVRSATRSGSAANPRVDIILEPAMQITRGSQPADASSGMIEAWDELRATAYRT